MKYIYIIILAVLLTACSRSNYQHATTKEVIQEETHHQEQKNLEKQTEETEITNTQEETQTEAVKIEFDTDKPTNPETGLPPVKSVTYTGTQTKQTGIKEKQETTQEKEASQEETTQAKNKELETEDKKETVVETKEPSLGRVLLCILAIVGCYWLHDVIRQNWNKIKAVWKK